MRAGLQSLQRQSEPIVLFLALALLVRAHVWVPLFITGNSMLPTLHSGQFAGLNKLAYVYRPPQRGDIVAVWTEKSIMVKRIIGLPGEEISVQNGVFFINGWPLREPYVQFQEYSNVGTGRIGKNQFVVAGDNRSHTIVVVVGKERILGRLMR
jgi:signal peptidase I